VKLGLCHGPWVKATAVADALSRCRGYDVVVVADSDVWCDGIDAAIDTVGSGRAAWAIPHHKVRRLDEASTARVLDGGALGGSYSQSPYVGVPGGGLVVTTPDVYDQVPLDARFVGWGQEDESWARALSTMVGAPWRGRADLWHLWHPPQARQTRVVGSEAGRILRDRYRAAAGNRDAMAELLSGARRGDR
jgi:hypothetical protein